MNTWFADCDTVAGVKTLYRTLAKRWHPDLGGDTATMQQVNAAYKSALSGLDGQTVMGDDQKEHVYHYNAYTEQALMDKVVDLLKLHMVDVKVEIIGSWIWILGATRPYKDSLKAMGLWWNGRRGAWSFHTGHWNGHSSPESLDGLARTYGLKEFANGAENTVAA